MSDTELTGEARAAEIERLRAMFGGQADFYLMHRELLDPKRLQALLLEHLRWLADMQERGHLVLSGPRFEDTGVQIPGLSLLRAGSWEEAHALARSDPHVASGAVELRLERWRITCGRISLSCDLSAKTVQLA
jgi:uncharacterized protein YciI